MMNKRLFGIFLLAVLVFSGCAAKKIQEIPIIFPQPPEEPRIVYLRSHTGPSDYRESSFLDAVFGEEPTKRMLQPQSAAAWNDKVYVAVSGVGAVYVFDDKNRRIDLLGVSGRGILSYPLGVAVAGDGTVYVSDHRLKNVYAYGQDNNFKMELEKSGVFKNPVGLSINDRLGRLYVVDSYLHSVRVYDLGGKFLFAFGGQGHNDGQLFYPTYIAVDRRNNNVAVVDTQNFRVQLFDQDGKFLRKMGSIGDSMGKFARPKGVGIDSEGHIYVGDTAFGNIQIFNDEGQFLMFFGQNGTGPATFSGVGGIFIDEQDRIYVTDIFNSRVQVFQYLSEQWKKEHAEEYQKMLKLAEGTNEQTK